MKLIEQSHQILFLPDNALQLIEKAGRTCYKSEDKITSDSSDKFVKMLIDRGHLAMIEFGFIGVKFITNRGVTHEMVRHRMCSFAQESTRYVKYDGEMEFVKPVWWTDTDLIAELMFLDHCKQSEQVYKNLLKKGWPPQQAREVLPNALKTEIVVGANIREWIHIFTLRCSNKAHPQMSALMRPVLEELKTKIPVVFEGITY